MGLAALVSFININFKVPNIKKSFFGKKYNMILYVIYALYLDLLTCSQLQVNYWFLQIIRNIAISESLTNIEPTYFSSKLLHLETCFLFHINDGGLIFGANSTLFTLQFKFVFDTLPLLSHCLSKNNCVIAKWHFNVLK